MMDNNNNKTSTDLLGLAPYGESLKIAVEKGFGAAEALLSRICLPAAEELGLMYKDKVRHWRLNNIIKIIEKSNDKLQFIDGEINLNAHPRVIKEIIENGSWCDDDTIQEMWAGLIASSCNEDDGDDLNLIFVNTLKQLTRNQVKILNYICSKCIMNVDKNGFIQANHIEISLDELSKIVEIKSVHQIDSELDFLRSKELLISDYFSGHGAGFVIDLDNIVAHLEPSPFAINLFIRGQGFKGSPKDFYKLEYKNQ
ncbi:Uncharacterised protein [Chryseobacterium gleum]|uniref:DUF4393 domain-containing protein n=2 Tax=Chryseobacterium gleum TaxID=250 RepID=A0A448B3D5_CHRGE|nr:Abi-alpha family protein [Chryseobacterium gleum]EFK36356.1 hypothetical protein HMPREF0204_11803 [Chryseobacterium gleum ATCC 35910]QQY33598.1 DUF4393 domain-containing protein [Chryseobacterium gleum]VEE08424.1 Uncharacterised protein [Chryseobacterium gleum]